MRTNRSPQRGLHRGAAARTPQPRSSAREWLVGLPLAVKVVLSVTVVVLLLGIVTFIPHPTLAGALGLLIVGICLTGLVLTAIRGPFAPIALSFWAFVVVWVGFPPLLQIRDGRLPWADTPLTDLFPAAQVILLLAVVGFWCGYALPAGASRPAADGGTGRLRLTARAAIAVTAATTALALIAIPATGGLLVRFTSRDELKAAVRDAGLVGRPDQALIGFLGTLPAGASLCALVMCLLCLRARNWPDLRSRRLLYGATAVAVILNAIFNNPLSASRFATFSVALAAFLCLVDLRRRPRRLGFAGLMLGGLALIYPLANLFRNQASRRQLRLGLDAYYTFDFDGFQQTVNSVYYVDVNGHTWGHHIVSALLFWVPRSIWDGKAFPAGIAVANARGYTFQNLALPLWAEFYVEYSWFGVALLMFCYGLIARRLDMVIQRQAATAAMVLAMVVAACQIGLLRGPTGAQIPFFAAAMVVGVAGMFVWRRGRALPVPAAAAEGGPPCTD